MFKKKIIKLMNYFWLLTTIKDSLIFNIKSRDIEKSQHNILKKIIRNNSKTLYGKKFHFEKIKNYKSYIKKVPLTDYEDYTKYINKIRKGENNVLTKEKVILFELSSGSTNSSKFIPYTKSLKKEFQKAINPWIFNLYINYKDLKSGTSYWSITPKTSKKNIKSKVPIGFEEDSEYLGFIGKIISNTVFSVPNEVKLIKDIDTYRYILQLFLTLDSNLSFISIWNPTYLDFLFKDYELNFNQIIKDIETGSINKNIKLEYRLRKIFELKIKKEKNRVRVLSKINIVEQNYSKVFSNLKLISCWGDSFAEKQLSIINKYFNNISIQPKGLISTEAFVSFPIYGFEGSILAINSHFYEFKQENKIYLANQLTKNGEYSVIVTTSGGLYRYELKDIVKVTGFYRNVPFIKFIGKKDNVSDFFGEKLNGNHISKIFEKLLKEIDINSKFYFLAPEINKKKAYCVFIWPNKKIGKKDLLIFKEKFEKEISQNFHYQECRNLNQLNQIEMFLIKENPIDLYYKHLTKQNKRIGDIKIHELNKIEDWSNIFKGEFII